ncbi:MAG: extracellular solute-binding protein [Lentimicrobium sp.]
MGKAESGIFIVFLLLLLGIASCNQPEVKTSNGLSGDLIVFHAGSLSVPFKAIADSFMAQNPGITVKAESAGSLASIRKITDLNRSCDVLASADYSLIDKLMIPGHASWNIQFAGNEMALVYQANSLFANKINLNNWTSILLDPQVRLGRSDPDSDPCGYRTILSLRLAEKYYHKPGLIQQFMRKDGQYIRPKEVDLLALLETGTIDYIFIYKSVAIQHKLPFLELPDSINLGNPGMKDFYSRVSVEVAGNKPGESITQVGEPMIYGITIPENCSNRPAAIAFVKYLITGGQGIMQKMGQTAIKPSISGNTKLLPKELIPLFQ